MRLYDEATGHTSVQFLEEVLIVVSYRLHTLLTDNGIQFAKQPRNRNPVYSRQSRFDMICDANEIEHRLIKPNHPWSLEDQKMVWQTVFPRGGQVGRMNRMIKGATVKRYHYDNHEQLRRHLDLFIDAYNHARRPKIPKGHTPTQFIWKQWQAKPDLFYKEPCHLTVRPYKELILIRRLSI